MFHLALTLTFSYPCGLHPFPTIHIHDNRANRICFHVVLLVRMPWLVHLALPPLTKKKYFTDDIEHASRMIGVLILDRSRYKGHTDDVGDSSIAYCIERDRSSMCGHVPPIMIIWVSRVCVCSDWQRFPRSAKTSKGGQESFIVTLGGVYRCNEAKCSGFSPDIYGADGGLSDARFSAHTSQPRRRYWKLERVLDTVRQIELASVQPQLIYASP